MNIPHSSIAHLVSPRHQGPHASARSAERPRLTAGENAFGTVRPFKEVPVLSVVDLPARARAAMIALRGGKRAERIRGARELGEMALGTAVAIPEAVIPLTVTLASDADEAVRQEAAWALWKLRDGRAVPSLLKAVLDDHSPVVREKAARALGLLGATEAIPVMIDLLTLERHVPARLRAGIAAAFGHLADGALFDFIVAALRDPEPLVRYEGVRALGRFLNGFPEEISGRALKLIRKHVRPGSEACGLIRQAAVKALRFHATEEAAIAIARSLTCDPDPAVREAAAEALLLFDRRETEAALIAALTDDVWQVRKAAARTLARFIIRHRVYNAPAVTEALRRMERMLPSHSLEWRLAAEAFASL